MTQEFIPYEQALAFKELGFDEQCMAYYSKAMQVYDLLRFDKAVKKATNKTEYFILAPLYQQAFRWFREKHGLIYSIGHMGHSNTWAYEIINISIPGPNYGYAETYEETEQACLEKLIQIVKNK